MEADRVPSTETIQTICKEYSDVFTGIGYVKGMDSTSEVLSKVLEFLSVVQVM